MKEGFPEQRPQPVSIIEKLRSAGREYHGLAGPDFARELIRLTNSKITNRDEEIRKLYTELTRWHQQQGRRINLQRAGEMAGETLDEAAALADGMVEAGLEEESDTARLLPAFEFVVKWEDI